MIVSKNNAGFTIIEVMIAVFIAGLVLLPILSNQSVLFQAIWRSSRQLVYLLQAKKLLIDQNLIAQSGQTITNTTKKIPFPKATLIFMQKKIPDNSSLKNFKNSMIQQVSWTDEIDRKKRKDMLVTFAYHPGSAS